MFIDMFRWNDGADWADMKLIFSRMPLIPQIFLRCWLQLFPLPEPRKAHIPSILSLLMGLLVKGAFIEIGSSPA